MYIVTYQHNRDAQIYLEVVTSSTRREARVEGKWTIQRERIWRNEFVKVVNGLHASKKISIPEDLKQLVIANAPEHWRSHLLNNTEMSDFYWGRINVYETTRG